MCKGCALGKYAKTNIPSSDRRSKGILDLIDSNICGCMLFAALIGNNYYVTFIDDFSRRTWIYFMKTKGEALVVFESLRLSWRRSEIQEQIMSVIISKIS